MGKSEDKESHNMDPQHDPVVSVTPVLPGARPVTPVLTSGRLGGVLLQRICRPRVLLRTIHRTTRRGRVVKLIRPNLRGTQNSMGSPRLVLSRGNHVKG